MSNFSTAYPARNRTSKELPILRIEIQHAEGTIVLDPNGAAILGHDEPIDVRTLKPVPGRLSDCSAQSAVLYRSQNIEIALSPKELRRFLRLDLSPKEFFALRDKYGIFFEIHDDFYDEETGKAQQPR
jgi:hypothetical protein